MWTGIPVTRIAQEESERLLHMEDALHQRVIGQQEAIDIVAIQKRIMRGASAPTGLMVAPGRVRSAAAGGNTNGGNTDGGVS